MFLITKLLVDDDKKTGVAAECKPVLRSILDNMTLDNSEETMKLLVALNNFDKLDFVPEIKAKLAKLATSDNPDAREAYISLKELE
jgi:hypothetical protein